MDLIIHAFSHVIQINIHRTKRALIAINLVQNASEVGTINVNNALIAIHYIN